MAEAETIDLTQRFFCHQCSHEITPILPDFTCPDCNSGFIEELQEPDPVEDDGDPATQFAELMQRAFMDSLQMRPSPNQPAAASSDVRESRESESDREDAASLGVPPGLLFSNTTPRNHRHQHGNPLELILQDLIQNITRGPFAGSMGPIVFSTQGNLRGPGNTHIGNPANYAWGPGGLDAIITQLMNQLEGTGPPPASTEEISSLKSSKITKEEVDKGMECSVCMEDFKIDEETKCLPCQHKYHPDCILPWLELHGTCPVCRKMLSGQDTTTAQVPNPFDIANASSGSREPSSPGNRNNNEMSTRPPASSEYQDMNDCD